MQTSQLSEVLYEGFNIMWEVIKELLIIKKHKEKTHDLAKLSYLGTFCMRERNYNQIRVKKWWKI